METKKSVLVMMIAIIIVLMGNVVPAAAMGAKANCITVLNGTGGALTALTVSPSRSNYPKADTGFAASGLMVDDKAAFGVVLPEQLRSISSFDITVKSNRRTYVARGVPIDLNSRRTPTLVLSRKGKESSFGVIGAVTGAAAGVLVSAKVATTAVGLGSLVITPLVMTTMVPFVTTVSLLPVTLGAIGYWLTTLFPGELKVEVAYK